MQTSRPVLFQDPMGNPIQEFAKNTEDRLEYAAGRIEYVGHAKPGTAEDEEGWQISKFEYDAGGNAIARKWANGSNDFKFVWDDRATYNY